MPILPPEILAIDWGSTPAKRQLCRAILRGKRYSIEKPVPVNDPLTLEFPAGALVGFDCPIGLSSQYAREAGISSFRTALREFGHGRFEHFYDVASKPEEVSLTRPFYPAKSAAASREDLKRALGDAAFADRPCDKATGAGPLFWLVGAKQCGRSSISVWRDVLARQLNDIALWPFDGALDGLLARQKPVIAEMYPAFLIRSLGLDVSNKRDPAVRARVGAELVGKLSGIDFIAVRSLLLDGFGPSASGEDGYDATLSAIALVQLVINGRLPEPPDDARAVEGWILGL